MGNSWSDKCRTAQLRPIDDQLATTRSSFGTLAAFMLLSTGYAGFNLYKFHSLTEPERNRVWSQYALFARLIVAGGVLGAAAWLSYMTSLSANFRAQKFFKDGPEFSIETTRTFGETYLWLGIYHIFEPLTFGCLTVSKLLVLDRMLKFNSRDIQDGAKTQLERFMKNGMRFLLFLNSCVVIAAWTSTGLWIQSYQLQNELADKYANKVLNPDATAVQAMTASARRSAVAYYAAELVVLLALASAFLVLGGLSILRLTEVGKRLASVSAHVVNNSSPSSNSLIAHASSVHRSLWIRVVSTVCSVFCSFIIRCVYNAMYVSSHQASINPECQDFGNCAECQSKLYIISNWFVVNHAPHLAVSFPLTRILHCRMDFTPEFAASITLISEPVTMLIALWAMTTHTKYRAASVIEVSATAPQG